MPRNIDSALRARSDARLELKSRSRLEIFIYIVIKSLFYTLLVKKNSSRAQKNLKI